MPTLRVLRAKLLRHSVQTASESLGRTLPDGTTQWGGFPTDIFTPVEMLAEAHGIRFECPGCYATWFNGRQEVLDSYPEIRLGVHDVHVFFRGRGVPDLAADGKSKLFTNAAGEIVRWEVSPSSTCLDNLSLTPSVLIQGPGCGWHGFVGSNGVPPGSAA